MLIGTKLEKKSSLPKSISRADLPKNYLNNSSACFFIPMFRDALDVESEGWSSGYYQRRAKKINASNLFLSLLENLHKGKSDLSSLAFSLGLKIQRTVDRQSVRERFNSSTVKLAKSLLTKVLSKKIQGIKLENSRRYDEKRLFSNFENVYLSRSIGTLVEIYQVVYQKFFLVRIVKREKMLLFGFKLFIISRKMNINTLI